MLEKTSKQGCLVTRYRGPNLKHEHEISRMRRVYSLNRECIYVNISLMDLRYLKIRRND